MPADFLDYSKHLLFIIQAIGPTVVVIFMNLLLYPFSRYILPRLTYSQNVIIEFIVGFSLTIWIFKVQTVIPVIMAVLSYIILDWNPFFTIAASFIFSSAIHIYCMVTISRGWQWMVNSITMIMFQKIWMTTLNVYYGKKVKAGEKVRPQLAIPALDAKPPFFEWFTYLFTPFGAFSGPVTCYKIQEYIFKAGERPRISDDSESHKAARKRFYMTFFWIIFSYISLKYAKIEFYSKPFYVNSSLPIKVILMMVCAFLHTIKYFSAWQPVEAGLYETGCAESGLCNFLDISNLTIIDVLMSDSNGIWLQRWNHSAHVFWKNYLLYPLLDLKVPYWIAHNLIFVFSALWHGFYPVYYMLLPEMLMATTADQLINGMFPDLLTKGNIFVRILYRFWIWMSMLVPTSTWWYRTADAFIFVRQSQKYFGSFLILLVLILAKITSFFVKVKPRKRKVAQNETETKEKVDEKKNENENHDKKE